MSQPWKLLVFSLKILSANRVAFDHYIPWTYAEPYKKMDETDLIYWATIVRVNYNSSV